MWLQREVNSTFYVNLDSRSPNLPPTTTTTTKMDTEVRTLKQELARTQDALRAATRRCRDLVRELDNRTAGHESERALRDQQLSKILRALLVLEARLKQEQKSIRQLLCEKDQVIRNQQLEIAKLRRYTKNYIKCNRESRFGKNEESGNNSSSESNSNRFQIQMDTEQDGRENSALSKDIQDLKCEIITKLTPADASPSSSPLPLPLLDSADHRIKKTHSFAGSDISKTSLTSSENTDVSIITTTTEGSPSLLSTEGFCEGESTDVSPSSTLNKSISRCTPTIMTDSENEITMILNDSQDEGNDEALENNQFRSKAVLRRLKKNSSSIEIPIITRSDSNDDGMDCNFASDDDDDVDNDGDDDHSKDAAEPVFKSSSIERFPTTNPQDADVSNVDKSKDFSGNNNNNNNNNVNNNDSNSSNSTVNNNNNNDINKRIEIDEQITDDTSGNWYSDPDEDRTNDDTLSHDTYHPNSNHNSVLECVNQILLRDIEEEENVLSITRRYKHRGKVVRFQAKLSDIESVGSEVERRNSEEIHKELSNANLNVIPCNNFETTSSEDEFGMRIVQSPTTNSSESHFQSGSFDEENADKSKAIPIVIIEPREEEIEEARNPIFASMILAQKKMPPVSPPLKLERIEEKACLQMSTKGLTIAKNLDYEDIESLPGSNVAPCKTPPALPPKPQFRNNTLILKKIPSPSFLIVESRKKQQQLLEDNTVERGKRFLSLISSPARTSDAQKSLNFDEAAKSDGNGEEVNFWRNKFNDVRSAFQRQSDRTTDSPYEECRNSSPKVTNMIRHFEEFKIGDPDHRKEQRSDRPKESRYSAPDLDQEFDMRQNFEEFNLDECDLSGDPDRPEGDGSERLGILPLISYNENSISVRDSDVDSPSTLDYGYDHFLEATGLSNKSILTPSRLLSNHKGMLKPKDIKYKSRVRATAILEKHGISATGVINKARVKRWTGPFV